MKLNYKNDVLFNSFSYELSVIHEVAIEPLTLLLTTNPNFIADTLDEVLIMGNNYESSIEVIQSDSEGINSVDVHVIGRLIHKNDVRLSEDEESEGHSGLLSSGEHIIRSDGKVAGNTEAGEVESDFFGLGVLHQGSDSLNGSLVQVKLIGMMLKSKIINNLILKTYLSEHGNL